MMFAERKDMDINKKSTKTILAGLGFTILLLTGYLLFVGFCSPNFELSKNEVTIEAGEEFEPLEYVSFVKNAELYDIEVNNPVMTGILGTYEVKYKLGSRNETLLVTVEDTTAPELNLAKWDLCFYTDEEVNLALLTESVKDATDVTLNLDTDGQEISVAGDYTIKVVASDAGGNETVKLARIHTKNRDTTPPEILDVKDLVITQGDALDLISGITVTDDLDPEPSIEIEPGDFDKDTPGEYVITYVAKDRTGNEATATRNVTVNPKIVGPLMVERPEGMAPFTGDVTNFIPEGGSVGWDATGRLDQPYLVCVNRAMCTVTVYGRDENTNYTIPVKAFACSVGREGHETITGTYKTTDRFPWCYMVDGTWGRYAIRISGGYMFHSIGYFDKSEDTLEYDEFNKLGSPASLGCVRLCLSDIYWLYAYCPTGFRTVIYDDPTFAGPLGKPTPPMVDTSNELTRNWDPTDPEYPY